MATEASREIISLLYTLLATLRGSSYVTHGVGAQYVKRNVRYLTRGPRATKTDGDRLLVLGHCIELPGRRNVHKCQSNNQNIKKRRWDEYELILLCPPLCTIGCYCNQRPQISTRSPKLITPYHFSSHCVSLPLIETHTIPSGFLILDHIEVVCR